ncbi:MAG: acetyl-CoA hydrolase/transferase C-terminal domain-containing protein, partial [Peptoniphilaceae bacterium]|nr:acetyl-CoA hydrolase/transferase C-terminal domain-containing protein [Peptoniphilaceae bacterium]MDY5766157.1 acetyl-CoA hydrolase/transferase C-terminal domain-containing protein [Peptoniphilaceae bacterium]
VESRIVPTMPLGTIMTDTRTTTHYIATEYGMVNLKGKSMWQRAELLISIAHPDFRDALIKQAQDMHIWKASNKR